ncbi:unnamed protein product [Acanthoscelides obtectus]|uniref:C2H2-type domain-containing protein n=1 Tax=Acanthoscelides obtectus TaxID=200917 RepID=A0A9P0JTZ0_ACAOB|nr:unnamed protein product [Acanthoscelides obtectus]CAK1627936.1 hypothetical protein AOBTE_LOCUS4922 [Acanthoscelides obtectus]
MTSVTLSSSSGQLNGGYTSGTDEAPISRANLEFEATPSPARSIKRPYSVAMASSESKKRRKQTTPVRIYAGTGTGAAVGEADTSQAELVEGKPSLSPDQGPRSPSVHDQTSMDCKKEVEDQYAEPRPDVPWMGEMHTKDWMSASLPNLPFTSTANPMLMALPQFPQPDTLPIKPMRIFNPDAYCEICSKEFCNKYFLKTHKANKHGIYTEISSSETSQTSTSITSVKLPNIVPPLETKPDPNVLALNPFCSIFTNSFSTQAPINLCEAKLNESAIVSNGQSSSSESEKVFPEEPPMAEYTSPGNTQTETTSKTEIKPSYQDTSNKLPEQQMREMDLSYRLRRLGVMNPKAFCEICCKEYCNKYFLRTHKLKRHGIYIPEDKEKEMGSEETNVNFMLSNNMQTSPLNLIMTEQNSSDCKTTSPSSVNCDIFTQNSSLAPFQAKISTKEETPEQKKSEAISEDLQKLQTMILQLNDLEANKASSACNVCNKEFENQFYLHAHMMQDHSSLLEEAKELEKTNETDNINNNTLCDMCGKEVQNTDEMTKHILEFHSNNQSTSESIKDETTLYNSQEKLQTKPAGQVSERRVSTNVTPTSSYCEICNKELCNKYFMKTHMQRMHGIEIENGAQIGGVVCDICNKELCSKYFLRVHKHNTHGIIEYGSNLVPPRKHESDASLQQHPPAISEPDSALKPGDLADLSHRYFTYFTEVCTICSRRFRSTKWLKAHLITDHGQTGVEKWAEIEYQLQQNRGMTTLKVEGSSPKLKIPNGNQDPQSQQKPVIQNFLSSLFATDESGAKIYQCSYCPFATPLLPLLFVHERSHSFNMDEMPATCPACPQTFPERELLQRHIITQHPMLLPSMVKEEDDDTEKEIKAKKQAPAKVKQVELSSEIGQSLRDVAKRMQWPATYAIPQNQRDISQDQEDPASLPKKPGYVMQAFLLEESTSERRVMPSVVFLPMIQKQPAPITVTFTLTPA